MQLRVAIPTHARPALLGRTLESLSRARRPASLERIVVVENGSHVARSACNAFADRLPLEYRQRDHPGKSRALQALLEEWKQGPVLFLDDDVRVSPGLLEAYDHALQSSGPGHFLGGPLSIDYETEPAAWLKPELPASARGWAPRGGELALADGETFLGANFVAFAEDVLAVGGFDPRLGPGAHAAGTEPNPTGEEREFQQRLLRGGRKPVYVPDARVWHWVPTERCSADWALQRAARRATSAVLRSLRPERDDAARILGVPAHVWWDWATAAPSALLARTASSEEQRYRQRLRFQRARGRVRGHRLAARTRR